MNKESAIVESWFNSQERIALLEFKAVKWIGTPWFPNSNTPGKGVSCQKLVGEIYREVGFAEIAVPEDRMSAKGLKESKVERFMAQRPEFERLDPRETLNIEHRTLNLELKPGDLLGFRMYEVVHHLGIVIQGQTFVHVLYKDCVRFCSLQDGTWGSVLQVVWRPVLTTDKHG